MSLSDDIEFKPKLSSNVRVKFLKKDERGEFYVIGITGRKDHLKIHGIGREIVEMLDGNMSISEIEERLREKEIETDVKRFINLLAEKGFLENRPYSEKKSERANTALIHYFPLFRKTEPVLNRFYSVSRTFFQRRLLLSLVAINLVVFSSFLLSVALGVVNLTEVFFTNDSFGSTITIYLFVIMPLLVAIHEFSHALVCFHYGGRPQEMGIGLFVFMPFFYADTTDAWMLNKRQSILVFLAGPLSTFFIGNLGFLLSFVLSPPYSELSRMVAFGSYLLVLYGFNPLMETDGYFVLQALSNFPNLISHARRYVPLWFKMKLRRLSAEGQEQMESYSKQERKILAFYAPLAFLLTAVLVVVMGYWGALFVNYYYRLVLSLREAYPNIAFSSLIDLGLDTLYLVVIIAFLLSAVRNYRATKDKS